MDSNSRWKDISALYALALEQPAAERLAYVAAKCGDDHDLCQQVESLLRDHESAQQTMSAPAVEMLARLLASDTASLVGRQLGAYRIEARLGSGGMGEVYRATDTRLNRPVALKILPAGVRSDPALRQRFEREAQAIAALRHPHICVLHDIGHSDGIDFLVMELLDGETLAERIARGPLELNAAAEYGLQIADALTAIHAAGMVHRDLKPGNVMLTRSGAKLLDFGLAKAQDGAAGTADGASWLALGSSTAAGTLPYMTPEQLDRGSVDHRSDLFAFGAVLYEMVTGRKAFDGQSRDEVMEAIRHRHPVRLPATLHASGVQQVIDRCLRKNPDERWPDAASLVRALQSVRDSARSAWSAPRVLAASVGALIIAGFLGWLAWSLRVPAAPVRSSTLVLGAAQPLAATEEFEMDPAWSPRGNVIAYAAGRGFDFRIVIRNLATNEAVPGPPASDGPQMQPRWSADGNRLLYLTREGALVWTVGEAQARRIASPTDVKGNFSLTLGPAMLSGAAWSPDGREIAVAWGGALYAVDVESGSRRHLATTPEELHWCDWSPSGAWIACTAGNAHLAFHGVSYGNIAPSRLVAIPAAGGAVVEVAPKTSSNQSPVWARDGRRLYFVSNRQGPSDIYAMEMGATGAPARDPVRITTGLNAAAIALSPDGRKLAYSASTARANVWSLPIPPRGARPDLATARQITFGNQVVEAMHVTPDRKWMVYDSDLTGNSEIYRMPLGGGEPERLTNDPAGDFGPEVSPDGRWLAFFSWRTKSRDIFVQPFDGGPVEQVTSTAGHESYPTWLPDGSLHFVDQATENGVSKGTFVTRRSPDGKWTPPEPLVTGAYRGAITRDGAIVYNKGGSVYIRRPGSSAPVVLYQSPASSRSMSGPILQLDDDEQLVYTKNFDTAGRAVFLSLPISGGPLTERVRFDDVTRPSPRFEFAMARGQLYFTIDERRSNIWIADLAAP